MKRVKNTGNQSVRPVDPMTAMPRTRQSNQTFPSSPAAVGRAFAAANEPLQGFEKLRQILRLGTMLPGPSTRERQVLCSLLFSL